MTDLWFGTSGPRDAKIVLVGEAGLEIPLTRGYIARVSSEDFERVTAYKWYADVRDHCVYARCDSLSGRPRLHQFILSAKPPLKVDHIDRDGLNCTRSNLRVVTNIENCQNRHTDSGIWWNARRAKFEVRVTRNYTKFYVGVFSSLEQARIAKHEFLKKLEDLT